MRRSTQSLVIVVICLLGLTGCISPVPPLRADHTAVIYNREIFRLNDADYIAGVLSRAAEITVDHGFRYFAIVGDAPRASYGLAGTLPSSRTQPTRTGPPIVSGRDTVIRLYSADDIPPGTRVWDAQRILTYGAPRTISGR